MRGTLTVAVTLLFLVAPGCSCDGGGEEQPDGGQIPIAPVLDPDAWITAPPALDGVCDDLVYGSARPRPLTGAVSPDAAPQVALRHTRSDLFLCVDALPPAGVAAVQLAVSTAREPGAALSSTELVLDLGLDGSVLVRRPAAGGDFVTVGLAEGDVEWLVGDAAQGELRLALDWLGGWARTDHVLVALLDAGGDAVASWPDGGEPQTPSSWGELVLGPLYPPELDAGSLFVDGAHGRLVVPYLPAFEDASELTLEAWVQLTDPSRCGTLLGGGRASTAWLGVCETLQFSHAGEATNVSGQTALDGEWHHVAVTIGGGERTLYLDGRVEQVLGHRFHRTPDPVPLGPVPALWRVGADPDVAAADDRFHGHVRELRVWSKARTREELVAAATGPLTAAEDGLVAVFPLTDSLADAIGGRDAGLVGDAALSSAAQTAPTMPPEPTPETTAPPPEPQSLEAFDGAAPYVAAPAVPVVVDGVVWAAEYEGAVLLRLEPDRTLAVRVLGTPDRLIFAPGALLGEPDGTDGFTLWIDNPDARICPVGAACFRMPPIRVELLPDGAVTARMWSALTGDFTAAAPIEVAAQVFRGDEFKLQDDMRPIESPWWSSELAITLDADFPLRLGSPMRLALAVRGHGDPDGAPWSFDAHWPGSFQVADASSWGELAVDVLAETPDEPPHFLPHHPAFLCTLPSATWPRQPPSERDYCASCPQCELDECDAYGYAGPEYCGQYLGYGVDSDLKWPLVDGDRPYAYTEGTVSGGVWSSSEDSPYIHDSHDVDFYITPEERNRWLTVGGGNEQKIESESLGWPPNTDMPGLDARPIQGDHVTALGRWIFDCGHAPKTELHPIYYFESDRRERRRDGGGHLQYVQVARLWLNSDPSPDRVEVDDLAGMFGPFQFRMKIPDPGSNNVPYLRVASGDPSFVEAEYCAGSHTFDVTVHPPAATGAYYFELHAGGVTPTALDAPWPYQFRVDRFEVYDDQDDGEENGEWFVNYAVRGNWRTLLWDRSIDSTDNDTDDVAVTEFDAPTVPLLAGPAHLQVDGWENDDPIAGDEVRLEADLPELGNASLGSHAIDGGPWILHYVVEQLPENATGGDTTPTFPAEWADWVADELVPHQWVEEVPATGGGLTESRDIDGFLVQAPRGLPQVRLFGADRDPQTFWFTDFPEVEFTVAQPNVVVDVTPLSGTCGPLGSCDVECLYVPPELLEVVGAKQYAVTVRGQPGADVGAYELRARWGRATLPPDDGEDDDAADGRLVALDTGGASVAERTVDIGCECSTRPAAAGDAFSATTRSRTAAWAWASELEDEDVYLVRFPRVQPDPHPEQRACNACESCDDLAADFPGELTLRAPGMQIEVPALGLSGLGVLKVRNLVDDPAFTVGGGDGAATLHVIVRSAPDATSRCVYRFSANWTETLWLKIGEPGCPFESLGEYARCVTDCQDMNMGSARPDWWWTNGPGLVDPSPERQVEVFDGVAVADLHLSAEGNAPMLVCSEPGRRFTARLYDERGVLIAEGTPIDEATLPNAEIPAGLGATALVTVPPFAAGEDVLLELVDMDLPPGQPESATARVALTPVAP